MNVYITLEYRSPYGTVNSLWAAARQHGFVPGSIYLLTPGPDGAHAQRTTSMLAAVQETHGRTPNVTAEKIDVDDLAGTRALVRKLVRARKMETHKVAVDVTAGRTIPKLALFQACVQEKPHHIFYLSVADYDYRDEPYVLVPRRLQESRDILAEVTGDG